MKTVQKCKKCGEPQIKWPLWKEENGQKKFIWINLFKMELLHIAFLISILVMAYGYVNETKACDDAINAPCKFCEDSGCCSQPSHCYKNALKIYDLPEEQKPKLEYNE